MYIEQIGSGSDADIITHGVRIMDFARRVYQAIEQLEREAVLDEELSALPSLGSGVETVLSPAFLEELGEALTTGIACDGDPKLQEHLAKLFRELRRFYDSVEVRRLLMTVGNRMASKR